MKIGKIILDKDLVFVSFASYDDHDLIRTVKNCYEQALSKKRLFFSIVSHEKENNIFDFSFIPEDQINYIKLPLQVATGPCNTRHMANSILTTKYKYFLQGDSHSRFIQNWDEKIIFAYNKASAAWGEDFLFTRYPSLFELDWSDPDNVKDKIVPQNELYKTKLIWERKNKMWVSGWEKYEGSEFGEKVIPFNACCVFGSANAMMKIPYDLYIVDLMGEEATMSVRAYVNKVPLIAPPLNFMYTNFSRSNSNRGEHWVYDEQKTIRDKVSNKRLNDFFHGKIKGIYGIDDMTLYEEYQKEVGEDFINRDYLKYN